MVDEGKKVSIPLSIHAKAAESFDAEAETLLLELTPEPQMAFSPNAFRPNMPLVAEFSSDRMLSGLEFRYTDPAGNEVARFFEHGGKGMGFEGEAYKKAARLCEKVQDKVRGPDGMRDLLGGALIRHTVFDWVRERYANTTHQGMTEYVLSRCSAKVTEADIYIPIAFTLIQSQMKIGRVTLSEFSGEMFDAWESDVRSWNGPSDAQEKLLQGIATNRQRFQGRAVAVVRIVAEPQQAFEIALEETEVALALVRLFSAANLVPGAVSYCAAWGRENIEKFCYFVAEGEGHLSSSGEGVHENADLFLKLDDNMIAMMKSSGFDAVCALLSADPKTEFQQELLDALLLYSRHTVAKNLSDKLLAIFGALDSFLLKNSNESIQQNIAERIAFAIGMNGGERQAVAGKIKRAYELRSKFVHHAEKVDDLELIQEFLMIVWRFFLGLIVNHPVIASRQALLDDLEKRKFA